MAKPAPRASLLRWARRWPPYALSGLTVSLGVGLVQFTTGALASSAFSHAAGLGALLASFPHLTGRAVPTFWRTLVGGLLAALGTLIVASLAEHQWLRGGAVALISFAALMAMAWGKRASPIVFSVTIAVIFSIARPSSHDALAVAGAGACGVVLYAFWAFGSAKLLEPRYRTLAVFGALEAGAALLRARSAMLSQAPSEPDEGSAARFDQLSDEVRLAQALQTARDLVYPVALSPAGGLQTSILARVAELREVVLTSRLDLDLLGHDHAARFVRARLALGLRKLSESLQHLALAQREGTDPGPLDETPGAELPDLMEATSLIEKDDPRARLLPLIIARLRYLNDELEAIRALLRGDAARTSLRPDELPQYLTDHDTWPLRVVREHLSMRSPVLRHALRSALALTSVYFLAYALPWATRPYWLLLSVAVVLRGTLDDTLSRRNARVLGTAVGCVLVALLVPVVAMPWLELAFVAAVGVSHAFVNVRYLLTAIAATIMALLQAHFAAPSTTALVVERLADTVIGATFAWAFSYVLPSWERRSLPMAVERALEALRAYSASALKLQGVVRAEQRLARQRAYDALEVVAAALRRSAAEPKRVRPPVKELVSTLDHAQRLMAHLSSLRSLLEHRSERLAVGEAQAALTEARQVIDERLSLSSRVKSQEVEQPYGELPGAPIEQEPMPWLRRRLNASIHDASEAGATARLALAALAGLAVSPRVEPPSS